MANDDDDGENTGEYAKSGVIISSVNGPDAAVVDRVVLFLNRRYVLLGNCSNLGHKVKIGRRHGREMMKISINFYFGAFVKER